MRLIHWTLPSKQVVDHPNGTETGLSVSILLPPMTSPNRTIWLTYVTRTRALLAISLKWYQIQPRNLVNYSFSGRAMQCNVGKMFEMYRYHGNGHGNGSFWSILPWTHSPLFFLTAKYEIWNLTDWIGFKHRSFLGVCYGVLFISLATVAKPNCTLVTQLKVNITFGVHVQPSWNVWCGPHISRLTFH